MKAFSDYESQYFSVVVEERFKETDIPYADSSGDGCRRMGVSNVSVGTMSPLLKDEDKAAIKLCKKDDSNFSMVKMGEDCPEDYEVYNQDSVNCL